ncbi:hypothetical protein D3C86_2010720 [compost metagenome]
MVRFDQSRVEITAPDRIISPPMVGVPFLVSRCPAGPSSRIGWPRPCLTRNRAIIPGPNRNTKNSAVTTAPAVRKVM